MFRSLPGWTSVFGAGIEIERQAAVGIDVFFTDLLHDVDPFDDFQGLVTSVHGIPSQQNFWQQYVYTLTVALFGLALISLTKAGTRPAPSATS